MMMQVGIVGMGIVGRLLTLALYNAGWQVVLFDEQQGDSNCSSVAAGLLTPFSECDKADSAISRLGQESITRYWPNILKQLVEPVYFQVAVIVQRLFRLWHLNYYSIHQTSNSLRKRGPSFLASIKNLNCRHSAKR